jgi:ABC-2 type transport system permease protein
MSSTATYARYEVIRTFRNGRFFIFSLGFPLVMYLLFAVPNRDETDFAGSGVSAPLYYMLGLIAFGTMTAVIAAGARIAAERGVGWNRQLRLTPLSARSYIRAKVISGYLVAGVTIVVLYAAGVALGVRIDPGRWIEMTLLILVALIPFAMIGIALGHLLTVDAIGPALGGLGAIFAYLGGTWYPLTDGGVMETIGRALPSYWLVQAGHVGAGGDGWGPRGWTVVALWAAASGAVAAYAYRRDTTRV